MSDTHTMVAVHEVRIDSIEEKVDAVAVDVACVKKSVHNIELLLAERRGGWKATAALLGGLMGLLSMVVAWVRG